MMFFGCCTGIPDILYLTSISQKKNLPDYFCVSEIMPIFAPAFACQALMSFEKVGAVGRSTYILKAFSGRFGFDILRISQVQLFVKTKATGTPLGGVVSLHVIYNNV